jgi:hypothetical protein
MAKDSKRPMTSPTGDVEYDEEALRDAEEKMHVSHTGETHERDPDPEGGHDASALWDAAKKMGADRS